MVRVAGESENRRARARRERQANVPGGRPHRHSVKLSDAEQATLTARAEEAGMTVPRLLVETTLDGESAEAGRAAAVLAVLELDEQVRRIGNNLNQLTRYAHEERELPEGLEHALRSVARACLSLDATARWVMGMAPAVDPEVVDVSGIDVGELDGGNEWAEVDLDDEPGAGEG